MYHHFVNSSVISLYPCDESQVLLEKMWWDFVSSSICRGLREEPVPEGMVGMGRVRPGTSSKLGICA